MAKARASRKSAGKARKAGKAKRSGAQRASARRPKPARSAAKARRPAAHATAKPAKVRKEAPVVEIPETPPPLPQPIASFTF
jgi:hypothetical protein